MSTSGFPPVLQGLLKGRRIWLNIGMLTTLLGLNPELTQKLAAAAAAAGLTPSCCCPSGGEPTDAAPAGLRRHSSVKELFSSERELKLAIVAGPAESRLRTALAALEQGLHVICEPPFCASVTDFERLRAVAAERRLTLGALQPWERCQAWRELASLVTAGRLGRVCWAQAEICSASPSPAGGVTGAEGWRAFAALLALVRLPPLALGARLTPTPEKGAVPADAAAVIAVQFGGADGLVRLAAGTHATEEIFTVAGDRGRAQLTGSSLTADFAGAGRETARFATGPAGARLDADCLAAELRDFAREAAGELPAGSSLRNSRYCAKLFKNAYYSASLRSAAVPL